MSLIDLQNVCKTLDQKPILSNLNLSIQQGDIMALVGPSGSGKSTLLRCLNRLIEIDSGIIHFNGKTITNYQPTNLRRQMLLVQQESIMFPGTVTDNITYGLQLQGDNNHHSITQLLTDVGLPQEFTHRNAEKLSGGEKKRVALARALALNPQVLLLDEPTSGVDPINIQKIEQTILSISKHKKLTVVWVTHDVPQAKRVSTRIANLKEGHIKSVTKATDFQWEGAY